MSKIACEARHALKPLGLTVESDPPQGWRGPVGYRLCMAGVRAARGGKAAEARRLNAQLQPLWGAFKAFSSLRVMYAIATLRGHRAEPPRPLLPLPKAAQQTVADA